MRPTFRLLPVILLLLGACRVEAPGPGGERIRFPISVNEMHPRVVALRGFADRLEAETGGRLRVEIFSGGQLYGPREAVQAAALGDVEMASEPETHFITFDPLFKAVDIPFVFETEERFERFLGGEFRTRVAASLEKAGLVLLGLWDEGPMVLAARDRLLRRLEDFRGVKIRSSGHDLLARSWNEMGAATVRIPIQEVYTALQQGVADAIYTSLTALVSGNVQEVAPRVVRWPSRAAYVWVVNRDLWESLESEDREIVDRLVQEATSDYHRLLDSSHPEMVGAIKSARNGEFYELSADELAAFRSRLAPLLTQWQSEYAAILEPALP